MAAVAAYITLLTLLQLLDTLKLRYKYKLNFIDPKQIDSLEEKVLYLVKFLESLPPRPDDPQIEPFLLEICVSVVKTCQDLDFQVVDQIRRAGRVKKDEGGKWLSAFREDMIKVISDLESIRCKVTGFNLESATLNTVSELPLISTDPSSSNSTIKSGDPKVIGFEHHVSFLKAEFILSHVKSREVIPIVGMGGIGKTTLARFVYEDPSIRRRFDKRYWATISQEYDLLRILQGILGAKDCDIIDLGTRLYQGLKGLRYLIVLDDMWDLGAWEDLRQYLPDDNQGSRIIVTSRDKNLADGLRSSKTCDVGFLSVEKSWELFCDRVFGGMCCPSEQLETIGRQIVKKCRGLPLGIITIAGLLSKSNKTSEYWSSVSKDVAALVNLEDNEHCKNTLSLSYDCLPLHLKPLFLYIGGFHNEGEGILMVELINSLVAFALVKPIHGKSIQQVTKDYLMELFQRNLIFIRYKDEINDIWRLGIHDLLRDLCLKEISHEKLFCRGFSKLDGCLKCISSSQTSFYLAQDVGEFWLCGSCNEFDKSEETSPSSLFWNIQVVWKREWEREHGSVFPINDIFWNSPQLKSVSYSIEADAFQKSVNESEHPIIFEQLFYLDAKFSEWTREMSNAMPSLRNLSCRLLEDSSDIIFPPLLERLVVVIGDYRGVECHSYPQSLRYLDLTCGKISCDQMNGLGMLPNLEALTVFSFLGQAGVWKPNEDGFRRLKYLCIQGCNFCKYWRTGSDIHFPQLETLVIEDLYVREIPRGLKDIGSLRVIELSSDCHKEDVVSRAKWILKQQRRSGNDQLRLFIDHKEEYYDDGDEEEEDDNDDFSWVTWFLNFFK